MPFQVQPGDYDPYQEGTGGPTDLVNQLILTIQSKAPGTDRSYYDLYREAFIKYSLEPLSQELVNDKSLIANIANAMESLILASIFRREVGGQDYPSILGPDTPTVNGIELDLFTDTFIFTLKRGTDGFPEEAKNVILNLITQIEEAGWFQYRTSSVELLHRLCANVHIASLFYYSFVSSQRMRQVLGMFAFDPCLASLFIMWGLETLPQGSGFFRSCQLDQLLTTSELPFQTDQLATNTIANGFPSGLGYTQMLRNLSLDEQKYIEQDGGAKFALYSIVRRDSWIFSVTKPGSNQAEYRTSWRQRLFASEDSQLSAMIAINEKYNLNTFNQFNHGSRADYFIRLGNSYKRAFQQLRYDSYVGLL